MPPSEAFGGQGAGFICGLPSAHHTDTPEESPGPVKGDLYSIWDMREPWRISLDPRKSGSLFQFKGCSSGLVFPALPKSHTNKILLMIEGRVG